MKLPQRLYLHIYLTLVGSLVLFALIAGVLWHTLTEASPARQAFEILSELAQASLPEADAPLEAQQAAIEEDPKRPRRIITVRSAGYVFAKVQDDRESLP